MKSLLEKNRSLVDMKIDWRFNDSFLEFTLFNQFFREAKFLIEFGADISKPTSTNHTFKECVVQSIKLRKSKGEKVDQWKQILSLLEKREATAPKSR